MYSTVLPASSGESPDRLKSHVLLLRKWGENLQIRGTIVVVLSEAELSLQCKSTDTPSQLLLVTGNGDILIIYKQAEKCGYREL